MQLSTRGRYAVMAMLDLAEIQAASGHKAPTTLAEIAKRQDISLSYLEQLFARLRRAGLVRSVRGPGGGYVLDRPASDIFVNSIVQAVNEPMEVTRCGAHSLKEKTEGGCVRGGRCNAHQLWAALGEHIDAFLSGISLQAVLDDRLSSASRATNRPTPGRVIIHDIVS
jgi:Rrf2 family iron-sulfur cluster assembly transcriptional regulator